MVEHLHHRIEEASVAQIEEALEKLKWTNRTRTICFGARLRRKGAPFRVDNRWSLTRIAGSAAATIGGPLVLVSRFLVHLNNIKKRFKTKNVIEITAGNFLPIPPWPS